MKCNFFNLVVATPDAMVDTSLQSLMAHQNAKATDSQCQTKHKTKHNTTNENKTLSVTLTNNMCPLYNTGYHRQSQNRSTKNATNPHWTQTWTSTFKLAAGTARPATSSIATFTATQTANHPTVRTGTVERMNNFLSCSYASKANQRTDTLLHNNMLTFNVE